ncbi:MAG: hypothetical protein IJX28_00595 [Clostridia bacterium]|nr:hypothetical protein [Clostridia bacterium]
MSLVLRIYKISEIVKNKFLSIWLSYLAGIVVEHISDSSSLVEVAYGVFNFSKLSIVLLWIGAAVVAFLWIFNVVFDRVRVSKKIENSFLKIMEDHTDPLLNQSKMSAYSWGYNKTICIPKNPGGWMPEDIYIDLRNSRVDGAYSFSDGKANLIGYDDAAYEEYCRNSRKIDTIRRRGDDRDRYAVRHVERSMKGNKVEIRLQKTKWSQLQFSWDYLRRLDNQNRPVEPKPQEDAIRQMFLQTLDRTEDTLINSFCLHLILVSSKGNVILSKISPVKSNDYPSTWAATLGEQIEREDFLNDAKGEAYPNFVTRWVKRALKEEFDIDEDTLTEQGISELEEYVDMDSLRVLSVDFEGDIYNVALTCLLKLKITAETLKKTKELNIDANENTTEFRECSENDVRSILLGYPDNQGEYHPSTYLRLLMFHLYSAKQLATLSAVVKDSKKQWKKTKKKEIKEGKGPK